MQAAAAAHRLRRMFDWRIRHKAPIDGVVDVRAASRENSSPGQPVLTLINPDDLWIRAIRGDLHRSRPPCDHIRVRLPSDAELYGVVFYRGVDPALPRSAM